LETPGSGTASHPQQPPDCSFPLAKAMTTLDKLGSTLVLFHPFIC